MAYCCCSVPKLCPTLCDPMDCSTLGFPILHYLPQFAQIHVPCVSDAIQPSHPLSAPSSPAFYLSQHQGLFKSALCIGWPEYWSFRFSISPSNEYSGLISFRMGWLYLAVQGTLKVFCSTPVQKHLPSINVETCILRHPGPPCNIVFASETCIF